MLKTITIDCKNGKNDIACSDVKKFTSFGIVTATDENYFLVVSNLIKSIHALNERTKIFVADFGMNKRQREWMSERGIITHPFHAPTFADKVFAKPQLIMLAPFDNCLWLDGDTIILRDLKEMETFTRIGFWGCRRRNTRARVRMLSNGLFDVLPIHSNNPVPEYTNAGVLGFSKETDIDLLQAWLYACVSCKINPEVMKRMAYHDEGSLFWAARFTGKHANIKNTERYNHLIFLGRARLQYRHLYNPDDPELLAKLKNDFPDSAVLHFAGAAKKRNIGGTPWIKAT